MKSIMRKVVPWAVPVALIVVLVAVAAVVPGCKSTVDSIRAPGEQVDRDELAAEVRVVSTDLETAKARLEADFQVRAQELNARIEDFNDDVADKIASLDRQDEQKLALISAINSVATSAVEGNVNPAAVTMLGLSALTGLLTGALGVRRPNDVPAEESRKRELVAARIKAPPP